ncbi:MAG: hypothetical protein ACE5JS_22640 [Nitrospinota bacterium]
MKAQYIPAKDELVLRIQPTARRPSTKSGLLRLWWDAEGNICAVSIAEYKKALEEFRESRNVIQLEGIWKGLRITQEDIKEARAELLKQLEDN